jgi:hypothetical protein
MELNLVQEITGKTSEEGLSFLLKEYIERKIADYNAEINEFERKYKMSFWEFDKKIREKGFSKKYEKIYGIIQVENDYFDWGGAVTECEYLSNYLDKLK